MGSALNLSDHGLTARGIEGVLARSLYFQFKDRAIRLDQESRRLLEFGSTHTGYKAIAQDVALIVSHQLLPYYQ